MSESVDHENRGRGKKIVLLMGCGIPVLLVVVPIILLILTAFLSEARFDDSDLRLQPFDSIPESDNAATYYLRANEVLVPYGGRYGKPLDSQWLTNSSSAFIASNRQAVALIRKAATMPVCRFPDMDMEDVFDGRGWLGVARLGDTLRFLSEASAGTGRHQEAVAFAMDAVRFAKRSGLLCVLEHGPEISPDFMTLWERVVTWPNSAHDLSALATSLENETLSTNDVANMLREGYALTDSFLALMLQDVDADEVVSEVVDLPEQLEFVESPLAACLFNAPRTRGLVADYFRGWIQLGDCDFASYSNYNARVLRSVGGSDDNPLMPSRLLSGNAVGQVFFADMIGGMGSGDLFGVLWHPNICNSCIRLIIGLKQYEEDHGELPETLAELVPKYIDSVPIDPYDRKPMRYSREKAVVYSIGSDLKDGGGNIWNRDGVLAPREDADIAFPIYRSEDSIPGKRSAK